MERIDRDQCAEHRAGRRDERDQEDQEREHQQYNITESKGEKEEIRDQVGSNRRNMSDSSRRNRSTSRGRNAIVNSFKLNLPVFKGSKKADPDIHIQAFEQWAKLKRVDFKEYEDYYTTTLKESAHPLEKLPIYQQIKRAFLLRFKDEKIDEDILCKLGKENKCPKICGEAERSNKTLRDSAFK